MNYHNDAIKQRKPMKPIEQAPRQVAEMVSRFFMVLAVTAMAGAFLAQNVDAKRIPANGVSIAERVQNQRDNCELGGGTLEETNTAFGSTITKCKGGKEDGYTCVNTAQSTNCHKGLVRPDQDVNSGPTDGVFEEPTGPLPGAVEAGGNGVNGRKAKVHVGAGDQHGDHHHGKGHGKGKSKSKRKGGRGGK
jgi:hypothetical protein